MQIEDEIKRYICENLLFTPNGYPHADDASFLETGTVDSVGVLELVLFVEQRFVPVGDQDITPDNFDSVSNLAAFIRRKLGEKAPLRTDDQSTLDG